MWTIENGMVCWNDIPQFYLNSIGDGEIDELTDKVVNSLNANSVPPINPIAEV